MGPIFDALGSATRRRILDIVKADPGCTVGEVAARFDVTRIAVMHQIRVLEETQLLVSRKEGRRRRLYFNAVPIQMIHDRWSTELSAFWASRLADVKYSVENPGRGRKGKKHGRAPEDGVESRHQGKDRRRLA